MLRAFASRLGSVTYAAAKHAPRKTLPAVTTVRHFYEEVKTYDEEFDKSFIVRMNSEHIDGWALRNLLTEYQGHDVYPEPEVMIAGLKACRRINDLALAIRFIEASKRKCGNDVKKIWPWLMQEVGPTMKELGIPTLEELGYDKPELFLADVYDIPH